jgi:transcriptional regulator with XRE-family HTH domain
MADSSSQPMLKMTRQDKDVPKAAGHALPAKPDKQDFHVEEAAMHVTEKEINIGHAIRKLRKERGISQAELAGKACVNRTTIARIECGIFQSLSIKNLEGIGRALEVDLKTLLGQAESASGNLTHRSRISHIEFSLHYPKSGFRIASFLPKRKEFFFGKIEIDPKKNISPHELPHPEQIYVHTLEGKIVLTYDAKEFLLQPGDCLAFSGNRDYEIYNPDQLKPASILFITYPSFLHF